MSAYFNVLSTDSINLIKEHNAAAKIQKIVFKKFYLTFGPTWKQEIRTGTCDLNVYDYDYYAYRNNLMDPWHDYIDSKDLQYKR